MRALNRACRQADALMLYRMLRKLLVDELCVEPSIPIRQLHQQILNADAALLTDASIAESQVTVAPARAASLRVPSASGALTGRARELSILAEILDHDGHMPAQPAVHAGVPRVGQAAPP